MKVFVSANNGFTYYRCLVEVDENICDGNEAFLCFPDSPYGDFYRKIAYRRHMSLKLGPQAPAACPIKYSISTSIFILAKCDLQDTRNLHRIMDMDV